MISSARSIWRSFCKALQRTQHSPAKNGRSRRGTLRQRTGSSSRESGAALFLEERVLLSTITVTSAADVSGAHSGVTLRDAINQANSSQGADTIVFDPSLNGTSIKLTLGELKVTDDLTIRGNGAQNTIIDAQTRSRVFNVTDPLGGDLDLTLDSVTVTNGKTSAALQSGGGIYFFSSGSLNIVDSMITGNSTIGTGSQGGAIYSTSGLITLTDSTLAGNKTTGSIASGGGIYAVKGSITLQNSTLTGNSTSGEQAFGGGISSSFADVTLDDSTVARNSTTGSYSSGGGLYVRTGHITLSNSILALNTIKTGGYPDVFINYTFGGTFSADHSLIGNRQGLTLPAAPVGSPDVNGNMIGLASSPIDPKLGLLANNGGSTMTLALLTGSPAMNMGGSTSFALDQRGFTRVVGTAADMGAFEFGASAPTANDPPPPPPPPPDPTVALSLGNANMAEAGGQSTVTATLSAVSTKNVTITLGLSGTATLGSDYSASALQIVIPAGQLSGSITLTAIQDTLFEGNESVIVGVSSIANGTAGGTQQVTATIVDDDSAPPVPSVSLGVKPANMAEAGGKATVTATLSAATTVDVTVNLGFSGSATSGVDYTSSAATIVIRAGQLSGTITLTAIQDALYEGNEKATVGITSVVNGTAGQVQSVNATIVDDDTAPTVTLSADDTQIAEANGQSVVTATLSKVSGVDTTVYLAFSGTAVKGTDYTGPTKITIPAGQLSASITLVARQNSIVDGSRTIVIDISKIGNGFESGVQEETITILDDDASPQLLAATDSVFADPNSTFWL